MSDGNTEASTQKTNQGPDQALASDQRTGGILTPTLGTLVADEPPKNLGDLLDRERRAVAAATTINCLNPDCRNQVSYPGDGKRTRPSAYCTPTCRSATEHARDRLKADLAALEAHEGLPGTARERRALNRAISIRRWRLRHYPE